MILIDRSMPSNCYSCPCCHVIGNSFCAVASRELVEESPWDKRPDWCPLKKAVDCNHCENGIDAIKCARCMAFGDWYIVRDNGDEYDDENT